jgi:KaiC/GvpD/RAD55 family RecA-like ATPase
MVLANSLYTIICTEIGAAFDSEFSNHELVRSQNNGSNAIYAGISTSQIRFPAESVLEYLARKRTLSSSENDWLTIHKAVENKIREIDAENKALGRRAPIGDAAYAELVINALNEKLNESCEEVTAIYERGVVVYDEKGKPAPKSLGETYFDTISKYIDSRLPALDDVMKTFSEAISNTRSKRSVSQNDFVSLVNNTVIPELFEYYKECFTAIKAGSVSAADAILTLDKKKVGTVGERYSLAKNLLMTKNDKHVHPVFFACLLASGNVVFELATAKPEGDVRKAVVGNAKLF